MDPFQNQPGQDFDFNAPIDFNDFSFDPNIPIDFDDDAFDPYAPIDFGDNSWIESLNFLTEDDSQMQLDNPSTQANSNTAFAANTFNQPLQPQQQPAQSTNNQIQNPNYGWNNQNPTQAAVAQSSQAVFPQPSNSSHSAPVQPTPREFVTGNDSAGPQFTPTGPSNPVHPQAPVNNTPQHNVTHPAAPCANVPTPTQPSNGPDTNLAQNMQQIQYLQPTAGGAINAPASSTQAWEFDKWIGEAELKRIMHDKDKGEMKETSKDLKKIGFYDAPPLPDDFDVHNLQHRLQYFEAHVDALMKSKPFWNVYVPLMGAQSVNSNTPNSRPKKRGKRKAAARDDDNDDDGGETPVPKRRRGGRRQTAEEAKVETQQRGLPQIQNQQSVTSGTERTSFFPPQPTDLASAREQQERQRQRRFQEYQQQQQQQLQQPQQLQQHGQMNPQWSAPHNNPIAGPFTYPAATNAPMGYPRFSSFSSNLSSSIPQQPPTPSHGLNQPFNAMHLNQMPTPRQPTGFGQVNPHGSSPYGQVPTPTPTRQSASGLGVSVPSDYGMSYAEQMQFQQEWDQAQRNRGQQRQVFAQQQTAPIQQQQALAQQPQQPHQQAPAHQQNAPVQQQLPAAHAQQQQQQDSTAMPPPPAPPASITGPTQPTESGSGTIPGLFLPSNLRATSSSTAQPPNPTTAEAVAPTPTTTAAEVAMPDAPAQEQPESQPQIDLSPPMRGPDLTFEDLFHGFDDVAFGGEAADGFDATAFDDLFGEKVFQPDGAGGDDDEGSIL